MESDRFYKERLYRGPLMILWGWVLLISEVPM